MKYTFYFQQNGGEESKVYEHDSLNEAVKHAKLLLANAEPFGVCDSIEITSEDYSVIRHEVKEDC